MNNTIIETQALRKTFKARSAKGGKTQVVEAVQSINLQVQAGEVFGFLGPNGAGKSTTLRMLTTLIPPTSGQARVAGYDLLHEPGQVRKRIGYVSQAGGTDISATGRENLMLQARLYGLSRRDAEKRTNNLLGALELETIADRQAKTYSGGQRRRLDLALGMVNNPLLLFLDEPTTGLDPQSRARLWDEVRKLRENGTTVFLTTHYLEEADVLADRLAIMDGGRIVAEGTPDELKQLIAGDVITLGVETQNGEFLQAQNLLQQQAFVREVHPGENELQLYVEQGEENLPAIMRLLDGAGLRIRKVALTRPSLDDVFLRKTGRSLREAEQ
ncbi:MAG TPA: ATP-binding cassette domain-containing protein [Ktedonobacteraceae bacterium]|nr:ATP-binding cassette domain-containing protein [Ktedonobacteraceae bacterium]